MAAALAAAVVFSFAGVKGRAEAEEPPMTAPVIVPVYGFGPFAAPQYAPNGGFGPTWGSSPLAYGWGAYGPPYWPPHFGGGAWPPGYGAVQTGARTKRISGGVSELRQGHAQWH